MIKDTYTDLKLDMILQWMKYSFVLNFTQVNENVSGQWNVSKKKRRQPEK